MGGKRVGLKRIEALMENLKRNLNLSGSSVTANNGGNGYGTFGAPPIVIDDDSTVAAGTDEAVMIHQYPDGLRLHVQNIGTQAILIPAATTTGMNYGYDQTNEEGVQWVASLNTHKGTMDSDRFKIGTSKAFFAKLKFSIGTVAGTDDCLFGFRKVEAEAAAVDNYNDMAALNVITGDIKIETILDNAATTTTDTTDNWADGEIHELKVLVSAAGAVTYKIDGADPSTTAAFTFDDGEEVTPFFYFTNATGTAAGAVILEEVEWGLQ